MKPKNKSRTWQAYIFMLAIFISPLFVRGQDSLSVQAAQMEVLDTCDEGTYYAVLPTLEEIAQEADVLSAKYKIPAIIIKALMEMESNWNVKGCHPERNQKPGNFCYDGFGADYCEGLGLIQITVPKSSFQPTVNLSIGFIDESTPQGVHSYSYVTKTESVDLKLLRTNWKYAFEIGVRTLLSKLTAYSASLDMNILENWYYPIARYNGATTYNGNPYCTSTPPSGICNDPNAPYLRPKSPNSDLKHKPSYPYQEAFYNIVSGRYISLNKAFLGTLYPNITLPGPQSANVNGLAVASSQFCFWDRVYFKADQSKYGTLLGTVDIIAEHDQGKVCASNINGREVIINRVPFGSPIASSTTQTLTLSKGANVISTPLDTAGKTLAQILNNADIDAVAYNLTDLFNRNTTTLSNTWNQAMKAGDSYMIFAKKNTIQILTGVSKSLQAVSLKASSWNVLGTTQPVIPLYRSTVHDKSFYFQDTFLKSKQLFSEVLQTGIGHFIYNKGSQVANFFTANEASQGIANGNVQNDMDANALLFASMSETEQRDFMQASLKSDMKRIEEVLESQQMALAPTLQGVMTISQSGVANEEVKFGFDNNATDYFDANLDVYVGTPVPGELYTYIDDPTANVTQSYKSVNTFKEWELYVRSASIGINEVSNLNPVTLQWSFPITSGFKPTTKIELLNAAGSVLVSDMRTATSYSFGVSSPNTERRFIIRLSEGTSGSGSTGIDLTPANPLISTTQLFSGNAFKWTTDVCNIGTTALSQTISVGMYFSKDTQWDASDVEIDVRPISNVLAGACTILNSSTNLPSSIAVGSYYMIIKTDIGNQISELSETNNTITLATPIAISTTPSYTITTKAESGRISLSPAQTTYTHGTYVKVQAIPETGYRFVGWEGSLSGDTNPTEVEMNGNKYIVALFAPIISSTGVDLRAEILSVPSGAYAPGSSPNFNGKICNIGTVNSTSVATHVLVLSEDRYWGANDTIIGSFGGTIMAGNCQSWSFVEKIPTTLPNGTYWVLLVASYDIDQNDTNPDNNIGTTASTFTITGSSATTYPQADIQFGDGVIPYTKLPQMINSTSLKSGETISVTSDICVTGLGQVNKSFKYRLWLSQDQVLDNTDTFLHWSNTLITFGGSIRCKMALNNFGTIPQGLSGKYNVILVLDADNEIAESNETNNRMIWEVDINATSATTPTISATPSNLTFSATQGTNPNTQTFNIANSGTGTLNWSVTKDASWLTVSPTSGTNTGQVTVSVNTSGLNVGTYNGTITITATGATNTPQTIPISLQVTATSGTGNCPANALLCDDFNDGVIDRTKWDLLIEGNANDVREENGVIKIEQNITDKRGYLLTKSFNPSLYRTLNMSRKILLHKANENYFPMMRLCFDNQDGSCKKYFAIIYESHQYAGRYGVYAHSSLIDPVNGTLTKIADLPTFDQLHTESWSYNIETGRIGLTLNGVLSGSFDVGKAVGATSLVIEWDGYGWGTGHYIQMDDMVISADLKQATNQPPSAKAQTITTNEDDPKGIILEGTDPEGQTLTYSVATQPTKGTLSGTAPNVTYTPNKDVNGTDSFTFTVNDGTNTSAPATVSITIAPVNDAPVCTAVAAQNLVVGTNKTVTLTCTDPDGDTVAFGTPSSSAANIATATISGTTLTINPVAAGTATITVTANDGKGGTVSTSFVVTVNATATPTLSVTPAKQTVVASGGASTFAVSITNSTGTPTCASNATWLTVTTCSATQVVTQATANTGALRSGTVTVTLAGATGSPTTVTIEQAAGSTSNDPALVIGNASGRIGQPVNIPISVSKFTRVGAITLKVVFDPSILTFNSVINPPTGITFTANAVNGVLTLIWFDATGGSNLINIASGKLCDLVFTYNGGTGNVSVSAPQSEIADKDGVKLNVSFTGGQVALSKASVAGKTVYASTSAAPLAGMSVSLTPSGASALNAVSDTDGNFRFDNLPDGGAVLKATKTGGWNEAANGTDAFQGARLAAGLGSFSPLQQLAADVNNSGSVNGTDAFLIARRATGLTSSFTRGDWVCEEKSLTIANNDQSEDIKCLAVGDVNMSYTPSGIATRALYKTEMARSLALQNVIIGNGAKNFTIPVMVKEFTDVGAITLKISFDASLMSFNKVSGTPAGVAFTSNAANGILTLIWFDASGGSNPVNIADGKLLDIEFNLIGGSSLGVTRSISINKNASEVSDTNGNPLSITYIDASATLLNDQGDEVSSGFSLAGIYPNPFYATTTVQFNLPSSSLVSLKVYDLMGRQIWQKEAEMVVSGSGHQIQIEATGWSSGTYLVVLTAQYGNQTLVEKSKIVFVK